MDLKIFKGSDGKIYQLADIEKIKSWNAEMPLIFIGFIKDKQIQNYPKSLQPKILSYLDEILETVAIPKLMNSLDNPDQEKRSKVCQNLLEISDSNPDLLKIAIPHIKNKINDPMKDVSEAMKKTLGNYEKAQKKKKTAEKRKILKKLRQKMDKLDIDFAEGKISDEDYLTEQREFLKLKREIDLAEN